MEKVIADHFIGQDKILAVFLLGSAASGRLRTIQLDLDMAQHIVAVNHFGMPQNSAESFILLEKNSVLSQKTAKSMEGMTGFRNVAIHEYQKLEMEILR